ncbi:MAG: transglycosylase domain-containing protein, partial [Luminiphilus sp.]
MLRKLSIVLLKLFLACFALGLLWVAYLDATISNTFDQKRYALPATVYGRSLELFEGAPIEPAALVRELDWVGYRSVASLYRPGQYSRNGNRIEVYTRDFKFPDQFAKGARVAITLSQGRVATLTREGRAIDLLRLEPMVIGGVYPKHGEDRLLVQLADVPASLTQGLLAIEDQRFMEHHGFSVTGIARAFISNVRSGRVVAGGSTITQQLVKNYYLTPERTITRKIRELIMSVLLEWHAEKEEILESYLNEIYLGQDGPRAIHGFALGALHYFDTPLTQLGLHQQALLVGMVKGPSLYNPNRNPERAKERRNLVLDVWMQEGIITPEQGAVAKLMPLDLQGQDSLKQRFPAYLDLVRRQLRLEYKDEDLTTLGLRIFTAFDPSMQLTLQKITENTLAAIDDTKLLQSASVVTRVDSGEVIALAGGRQVSQAGFNRALDARRPAGSLFKPAVYLAALEDDAKYSLVTEIPDLPLAVELPNGEVWSPENYDKTHRGSVSLYTALIDSLNLPAARLGLDLGPTRVKQMLQRLGMTAPIPEVASLPLG